MLLLFPVSLPPLSPTLVRVGGLCVASVYPGGGEEGKIEEGENRARAEEGRGEEGQRGEGVGEKEKGRERQGIYS